MPTHTPGTLKVHIQKCSQFLLLADGSTIFFFSTFLYFAVFVFCVTFCISVYLTHNIFSIQEKR